MRSVQGWIGWTGMSGVLVAVTVGAAATLWACDSGSASEVPCETCEDASVGSDAGELEPNPTGCDPSKRPEDSPECMNNADAVFVSPDGDDLNTGERLRPVSTIAAAMRKLGGKKRITSAKVSIPRT